MLFSLLKHYLDTDTALKVSQSVYRFTASISHGVENYFPRLWGTGISDAIFSLLINAVIILLNCLVLILFYPTALKGCRGIVFTHGVRMGGWWEKFVRPVSQKP